MMSSRPWLTRLGAEAVVFLGGALAVIAWRAGLPANAVLASVTALFAAAWLARRALEESRPPPAPAAEPDPLRLDQERQRRTLEAFLDQAPTPLLTLALDGTLKAVNRAARRLFHAEEVLADPPAELVEAIGRADPEARRTLRLTIGGLARTYALSVAEVSGAGGAVRLAALTDIQSEVQAAEAAALKELLQVLSHEIMNSLTPLASLAQSAGELLAEGGPANAKLAREGVEVIARRTEGLQRFVTAYRRLARLPDPAPRVVSLRALLEEAARLFHTRWPEVELLIETPSPDVLARLDPDLTAQALINLLGNAAEAATEGAAPPRVRLAGRAAGDGVVVAVEDTGPGVPPALAAEVFRPFFTTKADGSGIGLSLARQAIVSQGGQLALAAPGALGGAMFVIEL